MRLVTFEASTTSGTRPEGTVAFGRVEGDQVIPMGSDLLHRLRSIYATGSGPGLASDAGSGPTVIDPLSAGAAVPLSSVRLLAPLPAPGKIVCVGLNYRDHAEEAGLPLPEEPVLFAKFANSVIGPDAPIIVPRVVRRVDYEAELGVVIGKEARRVGVEEGLAHVAGYVCANDVSARDLQPKTGQWTRGKAVDSFLPTGPWLVTADEIPDPQSLSIRCSVSGEVLQDSNTSEMVFGVAELVSFISQTMTLEPGDLIVTGTPAGVGFARDPRRWLEPGDTVTVEIEALGSLVNTVERE
jgi:2-keto-4-pentenoate hydratase/2-oxohepta-3-ene-1,7-dioic acid hydratase in catechol pathway